MTGLMQHWLHQILINERIIITFCWSLRLRLLIYAYKITNMIHFSFFFSIIIDNIHPLGLKFEKRFPFRFKPLINLKNYLW